MWCCYYCRSWKLLLSEVLIKICCRINFPRIFMNINIVQISAKSYLYWPNSINNQVSKNNTSCWISIVYILSWFPLRSIFCKTLSNHFHNHFNKRNFNNKFNNQDISLSKEWITWWRIIKYSNIWGSSTMDGHGLFKYSWLFMRKTC